MLRFSCPNCGMAFSAPEDCAGRRTACRQCRQPLLVPGPAAPLSPSRQPVAPARPGAPAAPPPRRHPGPQPAQGPVAAARQPAAPTAPAGKAAAKPSRLLVVVLGVLAAGVLLVCVTGGGIAFGVYHYLAARTQANADSLAQLADQARQADLRPGGGPGFGEADPPAPPLEEDVLPPAPRRPVLPRVDLDVPPVEGTPLLKEKPRPAKIPDVPPLEVPALPPKKEAPPRSEEKPAPKPADPPPAPREAEPPPEARGADPEIVGTWQNQPNPGDLLEVWTIRVDGGEWSVTGVFTRDGVEAGSFQGKECNYASGRLTFRQQYVRKPVDNWTDNNRIAAKLNQGQLEVQWRNGRNGGQTILVRPGAVARSNDPPAPNAPPAPPGPPPFGLPGMGNDTDMLGAWEGAVDGLKEVWVIARQGDQVSVKGTFSQDNREVGSFHGENIAALGPALSFVMKLDRKPRPNWPDGFVILVRAAGGKLEYTWQSGQQVGQRQLTKSSAAKAPAGDKPAAGSGSALPMTPEAKEELAKLEGAWTFRDIMVNGKKIDFGATWTFRNGTVAETIGLPTPRRQGPVTVDPTVSPKRMDLNFAKGDGGAALGFFRAIYQLDGDTLTVCIGDGVPATDFTSTEQNRTQLFVLKRQK